MTFKYLAGACGLIGACSLIPQNIKIFRYKSAKDLNIYSYIIMSISSVFWILYGIELSSYAIVLTNIVWLINSIISIIGCLLYGKSPLK